MKQHMDVVLFQIVFPLICFNQQDEELWLEDPHEYVRKGYGACRFLLSLAETKRYHVLCSARDNLRVFAF
jgi:hypothetical protein